jgi:hypothetical protein
VAGSFLDERFFANRLRSTSTAGILSTALALCLFLYRFYANHVFSWDLLSIGLTFVGVKYALMFWSYAHQ